MRVEHLYEFIVPLIFIVIWAVTWILNRETQALPPRSIARESDEQSRANRARAGDKVRDLPDPRGSSSPRTGRSIPPGFERQAGRDVAIGPGDAIVFTEPELVGPAGSFERSASNQRSPRRAQGRRPSRAGGSAPTKPRARVTPEKPRELTQEISTSMASLKGKPLTLTPLNLPLSPLSSLSLAYAPTSSISAVAPTSGISDTPAGLADLRKTLADPVRLREIFVWNELMQPPLALRQGLYDRR